MAILEELIKYRQPLLIGLITVWVVNKLLSYRRIRQFNGPWETAFSNIPHNIKTFFGEGHQWYYDVTNRYGPIARIGPTSLVTSSPEVWIHINTKPGYKRSEWYFNAVRVEHRRDHVFSQTDTALHDERRKQLGPGYAGRDNPTLEPSIDARVQEFITLIRTTYASSPSSPSSPQPPIKPLNLANKIQYLTLDVISTVGLGAPFGMLTSDRDVDGYVRASEQGLRIANTLLSLGLSWVAHAPVLGKWLGPQPTDSRGFGAMIGKCWERVSERMEAWDGERKEDKLGRRDMIASFMRHGLMGDELRSEVLETLVAGSDTTAGALRAIMLYVMAHPRVHGKLQAEIDETVREGKAPGKGEGIVSQAVAKQMPYLQAVIREGLRIWPPVRNLLPKDVPAGGDTVMVEGKPVFLPGGVDIGVSSLGVHRDKKLYGEDAEMFRPERWFETDQEKLAAMIRVNDLTFGFGRWQCLGKPIAQMELNKVIFELLRNFDWAIATPAKPWRIMNTLGLFVINDMLVQATER